MKFWLLTTEYPPQSGGGISTYCKHTAMMLAERDHQVTVFVPSHQSAARRIVHQQKNIRVVYIRAEGNEQNNYLGYEAALSYEFAKVLAEFQQAEGEPDYIEAQEYNGIAYFALQRRLLESGYLTQCTFYVTAHAPGFLYQDINQAPLYQFPYYWVGEMERSVLRSADFVISPSRFLLDVLEPTVLRNDVTCAVVHNPFHPMTESLSGTAVDLVFFGKLTPQKGALEMLGYMSKLWDEGFAGALSIIGGEHFFHPKGMEMGEFVRKRFAAYIERGLLSFDGHIDPSKLEERLSRAHVVIVPSLVDNLPYTVLEAMSMGKIVLVSQQGGQAELIEHGVNGFLFSHSDPDSFNQAIRQIMSFDARRLESIGREARKTIIDRCGYEPVYKRKIQFLQSLSRKRSGNIFPYNRPRPKTLSPVRASQTAGLLSVVVPYYNLPDFIFECVESVYAGEYQNLEVIIVDDGSTHSERAAALDRVRAVYPEVKIIRKSNQGLAEARNTGATHATGEFVAFLDADDKIAPAYYQRAVHVLRQYDNVSFVGSWLKYFGDNDAVWPGFNPEPPYFLVHNMVNCAVVCKTADFLTAGLNDARMIYGLEDYESTLRMVRYGYQGVMIPEVLFHYRIRKGSMANVFTRYSTLYLYRLISQKHAPFFAEYAAEVANIINANGSGLNYDNPTFPPAIYAPHITVASAPYTLRMRFVDWLKRHPWLYRIARKIYFKLISRKR